MKPAFPNSAFVRAPERFVLAGGRWRFIDIPVRYGVFDHPIGGRCLVDTGYSDRTISGPRSLALKAYASVLRPKLTDAALPLAEEAVDTILLTHLHADHISALRDYPEAKIFANGAAVKHFMEGSTLAGVRHGFFKEMMPDDFDARFTAFESLEQVDGPLGIGTGADVFGDGSVLAVPLFGHMKGHTGVLWTQNERPLLYAADAEWMRDAIVSDRSPGMPARLILDDVAEARASVERIRTFIDLGGEVALCHDPEPAR
ncbi:MAG: MBL fold metallo-hydrolase [Hyphomonadaceae bacterium]